MSENPKAEGKEIIEVLPFERFIKRVNSAVDADASHPAFTLVIGSGFSSGLIPTAKEMALNDIPWWRYPGRGRAAFGKPNLNDAKFQEYRAKFWKSLKTIKSEIAGWDGDFPPDTPDNVAAMYKAVMSDEADDYALNTQELRTKYLRDVVRRNGREINYAHLFLAGILQAQYTSDWLEKYGHRRPFCKTVLTTNFDIFLQRALQLNNQTFYVSDLPENSFEELDDELDAIHIVQAHGSIFRNTLLNTKDEMDGGKEKNTDVFTLNFRKHGIIVIGYGGWDDAIMSALTKCSDFKRRHLYWCDIVPGNELETRMRESVVDLLKKKGAYYVQLPEGGADDALQQLHLSLVHEKYPLVLANPLAPIIESIKALKLPTGKKNTQTLGDGQKLKESLKCLTDADDADAVRRGVIDVLEEYQDEFKNPKTPVGKIAFARVLIKNEEWDFAERLLSEAIDTPSINCMWLVRALCSHGYVMAMMGKTLRAVDSWTRVINISEAPVKERVLALFNRGVARGESGDSKSEIEDYSRIIRMPEITIDQKVMTLVNRGVARSGLGDVKGAIEDNTRVINMTNAPIEQKIMALFNRSHDKAQSGDERGAMRDYQRLIIMADVPDAVKNLAKTCLDSMSDGLRKNRTAKKQ